MTLFLDSCFFIRNLFQLRHFPLKLHVKKKITIHIKEIKTKQRREIKTLVQTKSHHIIKNYKDIRLYNNRNNKTNE